MKSIYIHIPFCKSICSYCDFCKMYYNEKLVNKYLDALSREVKNNYKNEKIETLYIGGGTPSILNMEQLIKLFSIINMIDLSSLKEFTFECNVESLNKEKLMYLFNNKVNRLSIGVQSFNNDILKQINRNHTKEDIYNIYNMTREVGFNNINLDLIYGINNQNINDLKDDLNCILELNPEHISCYSLSIMPNTKMYIDGNKEIDQDIDCDMYLLIESTLKNNGYTHYEISNYSKEGYESIHNLTYWNNDYYYGFGLGASGYINEYRYDNTKNINDYVCGKYLLNKYLISDKEKMEYEMILGFRKELGINMEDFFNKYRIRIENIENIKRLLLEKKLIKSLTNIYVSDEWKYRLNTILIQLI